MAKLKKRAPMKAPKEMERNIQQIYDDINELIDAVNVSGDSASSKVSGKSGDTRVVKNADRTMTFQIRTQHGWSQPTISNNKIVYTLID